MQGEAHTGHRPWPVPRTLVQSLNSVSSQVSLWLWRLLRWLGSCRPGTASGYRLPGDWGLEPSGCRVAPGGAGAAPQPHSSSPWKACSPVLLHLPREVLEDSVGTKPGRPGRGTGSPNPEGTGGAHSSPPSPPTVQPCHSPLPTRKSLCLSELALSTYPGTLAHHTLPQIEPEEPLTSLSQPTFHRELMGVT